MNKKIIIFIGIILLFIAGVSFAAVLSNYGTIIGTASNVAPPEFYIGSIDNEALSINNKPLDCDSFGVTDIYHTFETKNLEGANFTYLPKISFQVRAKGTTTSTSSTPILGLAFGYYNGSSTGIPQYLASTTFPLYGSFHNYSIPAMAAFKTPQNINRFFYEFTKVCPSDDPACSISIERCNNNEFYTKVKLDK